MGKTIGLGRKANTISGVFYYEPTHGVWRRKSHTPDGLELPDLNELVRNSTLFLYFIYNTRLASLMPGHGGYIGRGLNRVRRSILRERRSNSGPSSTYGTWIPMLTSWAS